MTFPNLKSALSDDNNRRISYVDLAKGICIFSVIAWHLDLPFPLHKQLLMPVFFFLSGSFFKSKDFKSVLSSRFYTLIIPFIFFNILNEIYFFFETKFFTLQQPVFDVIGVLSLHKASGALWFLLALFWDSLLLWAILIISPNGFVRFFLVFVITAIGFIIPMQYNHWHILSALMALPYLYFGYVFSDYVKNPPVKNKIYAIGIGLLTLIIVYIYSTLVEESYIMFHCAQLTGNVVSSYITGFLSLLGFLSICSSIKNISVITYLGKYSLLVLCLHIYFVNMTAHISQGFFGGHIVAKWGSLLVSTLLCIALIPLFNKYLPFVCGKRRPQKK